MARDDDPAAWRASAWAFGLVRAAVVVRVAGLFGAFVELWSADHGDDLRITVVATAAMLISDLVAAAGAARLALRGPAGRRSARTAVAALLACAAFDTWALAWLTDAVTTAGPLLVHGMNICALAGAAGMIGVAAAAARALDRAELVAQLQVAAGLLVIATVLAGLAIARRDDAAFLLFVLALLLMLAGALVYIVALGRVRAAILDHAPLPPPAQVV
jgi:hypothetical protein